MFVKTVVLHYEQGDVFRLYLPSDAHCGTVHCAEDKFQAQMDAIKRDPFGLWIDGGDKGEFILPNDPRYDVNAIADWCKKDNIAKCQEDWYTSRVEAAVNEKMPYDDQSKCLGSLLGNHEWKMRTKGHANVQENICNALGIENLGYSCFLRLHFKYCKGKHARTILCLFKHGNGSATTTVGKMGKLQRTMDRWPTADIVGIGHMHEIICLPKSYMDISSAGRIIEKERAGAVTGCYFRTYSEGVDPSYGEVQGYDPTKIGCAVWKINPETGIIRVQEAYA